MFGFRRDLFAILKRNCRVPIAAAAQNSAIDTSSRSRAFYVGHPMDEPRPPRLQDRPLCVVVGCTGTGKTKLGVRLAKELDGEVVSADSIQVYKGLDVATNKATAEEMDGVPHHMMGTMDWNDTCNVHEYRNEALRIIEDVYSRGKVPVVVGGTSYYIEAIIYNNLVRRPGATGVDSGDDDDDDGDGDDDSDDEPSPVDGEPWAPSVDDFREYSPFRHGNDPPTADTATGAGEMYADALADAVTFARVTSARGRLSYKRYGRTFADCGGGAWRRWRVSSTSVAECETVALYAHGVRVLDAMAGQPSPEYEVSAADVTAGLRDRYSGVHVRCRLDDLLRRTDAAGQPDRAAVVAAALCRMRAEVAYRTQRLALALLVDDERTAVDLLSPAALKAHAAYFDPAAAVELHPHNTRKVFRIIQIYLKQGKQKSKLLEEQRIRVNGSDVPVMALRFKEVHMMWLTCDVDVLNGRLERRTDEMVERGLVDELSRFKDELTKQKTTTGANNFSVDFTKGVLQCIGVKQFQRYLELPDETRGTEDGRKALEDALATMKTVTKKYARRQTRWINNRFLKSNGKQAVSVYRLDCTDLTNWQRLSDRAVDLAQVVLGRKPRDEHTLKPMDVGDREKTVSPVYGEYHCDDCSRLFSNDVQYNIHMGSKKHVRVMTKRKRKLQDTTTTTTVSSLRRSDSDDDQSTNRRRKI